MWKDETGWEDAVEDMMEGMLEEHRQNQIKKGKVQTKDKDKKTEDRLRWDEEEEMIQKERSEKTKWKEKEKLRKCQKKL